MQWDTSWLLFGFSQFLKYKEIKWQIITDLLFYDNAISSAGVNDEMKKRVLNRQVSNRNRAADLTASYTNFPWVYKKYLNFRKEKPDKAAFEFIGLSNTEDIRVARQFINQVHIFLRIKPKIV